MTLSVSESFFAIQYHKASQALLVSPSPDLGSAFPKIPISFRGSGMSRPHLSPREMGYFQWTELGNAHTRYEYMFSKYNTSLAHTGTSNSKLGPKDFYRVQGTMLPKFFHVDYNFWCPIYLKLSFTKCKILVNIFFPSVLKYFTPFSSGIKHCYWKVWW